MTRDPEWDESYAEQLPRVLTFFCYRLDDTTDVADLAARTFENAWRTHHRYRCGAAGFTTWLFTIARNVAIDQQRRRHRPKPNLAAPVPWSDDTREPRALQHSAPKRLAERIATLPPRQRELIAMRHGAKLSNRAIARATGLSETNVEAILRRAVESLRRRW